MRHYFVATLLVILVCSDIIRDVSRCPTPMERRVIGSPINCSNGIYHCIRDESDELVEICNEHKLIPKGNYPYYLRKSDEIFYDKCPNELYQPFPAWSNAMSDCEYKKSSCNSIGQVPCDNGSATEEATCGCDFKKGFVLNGKNKCCSPSSSTECYCQYRPCENNLQELDSDYNCINSCLPGYERSFLKSCKPMPFTAKSLTPGDVQTTFTTDALPEKTKRTEQFSIEIDFSYEYLMFVVISVSVINVAIYLVNQTYMNTWRPLPLKIGIFVTYILSMGSFFGISIAFAHEKRVLAYVLTFIVMILLGFTCYLVYLLSVHRMIPDPEVYNEEYDRRIFRLLQAAKEGDLQTIKRLFYEGYIDMDDVDMNSRSALHLAVCEGRINVLEFILRHNLCVLEAKDRWNRTAEDYIKLDNPINLEETKVLLINYRNKQTNSQEKKNFKEIKAIELIKAAGRGDLQRIKRLHDKKTDMNLSNSKGQTALHAAVENGMEDIVTYLINNCKVSPFVRWSGRRPIDIAHARGQEQNESIIKNLEEYMSDLLNNDSLEGISSHADSCDMTVHLLNCASRGDIQQMKSFKELVNDMEVHNYDLQTALHIAVRENQEYIVEFLLKDCKQMKMAKTQRDRWNMTPWEAAKISPLQSVYNTFLRNCEELAEEENMDIKTCKLLNAAAEGDLNVIKKFYQEKIDMNQKDYGGRTALHLAVCNDHLEVVKFLIDTARVDIFISDRCNRNPIDEVKDKEIKDRIEKYQNDRKELNEVLDTEDTLKHVMQALLKGSLHTTKIDLRYPHLKMDTGDYLGNTPLHVAAGNGKLEDVEYLLKKYDKGKASPFVRNNSRKTPLELVEDKLSFMAQNVSDTPDGRIRNKFEEIKQILKKAMDDAKTIEIEKDNAFDKHDEKAKIFLFHNRTFKGDILAVRRFLKTDSTIINQLDYDSRSALHIAAAAGHTHLVEFLLNQGAEKNTKKDRYNLKPLDEANTNGDDKMKQLLQD